MISRVMSLSDMPVQQKLHGESLPANWTPVQISRMAGQVQLQLQLGAAGNAAEDASGPRLPGDTRGGSRASSHWTGVRDTWRRVDVPNVTCHFALTSEEALALARGIARRVLVVGQRANVAPVHPALLAVLHGEVDLYSDSGIEGVSAQGAPVKVVSVALE